MAAGSGFKCHGFRQYDCKNDNRHGFDFLNVIFFSVGKPERIQECFVLEALPLSDYWWKNESTRERSDFVKSTLLLKDILTFHVLVAESSIANLICNGCESSMRLVEKVANHEK